LDWETDPILYSTEFGGIEKNLCCRLHRRIMRTLSELFEFLSNCDYQKSWDKFRIFVKLVYVSLSTLV